MLTRSPQARAGLFVAAVAAVSFLSVTGARSEEDRHVVIINETNHTMVHFYASNTAENTWQEDILGDDVVPPGKDVRINVDDGSGHCKYDFKAVFDDGDALIRRNINVCEIRTYRYSGD